MLETLRTFARERLEAAGETHRLFRRHADHYTRFAEAADVGLAGPDEIEWRRRVHVEFDNLRIAFIRCPDPARKTTTCSTRCASSPRSPRKRCRTAGCGIGAWAEHLIPRVDLAPPALRTAVLAAAAFSAQGRNDVEAMRELATAALADGVPIDCSGAVWAYIALAASRSDDR